MDATDRNSQARSCFFASLDSGLAFLETPDVMPAEAIDLAPPAEPGVCCHGVEFRGRLRKIVISYVITKSVERLWRQGFPLGTQPAAITIKVNFRIFILLPHDIDHQEHPILVNSFASQSKENRLIGGHKVMKGKAGEDQVEALAAGLQALEQIALM